jgi:hypothetical protein
MLTNRQNPYTMHVFLTCHNNQPYCNGNCKTVWDIIHAIYIKSKHSTQEWEKISEVLNECETSPLYFT